MNKTCEFPLPQTWEQMVAYWLTQTDLLCPLVIANGRGLPIGQCHCEIPRTRRLFYDDPVPMACSPHNICLPNHYLPDEAERERLSEVKKKKR